MSVPLRQNCQNTDTGSMAIPFVGWARVGGLAGGRSRVTTAGEGSGRRYAVRRVVMTALAASASKSASGRLKVNRYGAGSPLTSTV